MTATGTVYGLADPRDGKIRYVGQTTRTLTKRLQGHYGTSVRRVRAWITELREAGMAPLIIALRENVPAGELDNAEHDEITRIIGAGGALLNEQRTARGHELNRQRLEDERVAAWRELAGVAMNVLGGPLPPGILPEIEIPDEAWAFISKTGAGHRERMKSLISSDYPLWVSLTRKQEESAQHLWDCIADARDAACAKGGNHFSEHMKLNVSVVAEMPAVSRQDTARLLALTVWYMAAMHPWRHLAELGALTFDDDSFITWAGRDPEVREALEFLAAHRQGALGNIPYRHYSEWEKGPGHALAAIAAAYSGVAPQPIQSDLAQVLGKFADDHEMTQPMADMLVQLDPKALDSVFGPDIATEIDHDLELPPGTAGCVLRAFGAKISRINDANVRRAIDRSAQALPVVPLPDYGNWWSGPGVLNAQVISGSLVRKGLAMPEHVTAEEYLADLRTLWTPDLRPLRRLAA